VDLRDVWINEATLFTPWLARDENIELLGDAIGISLDVEAQEKQVGPFRADILCKDTATDHWVLIENQLESTDHRHLGQLLTYAAGLNAVTIVWIAQSFTEEHRAALDWLNAISGEDFNFFGLEVELWRIGDSAIAPKFNVVSKPNDWSKSITVATQRPLLELTETKRLQLEFWAGLRALIDSRGGAVIARKPLPQHWCTFAIGTGHFHLTAFVNTTKRWIGLQLTMVGEDAKAHFHELARAKAKIEEEAGSALEWEELPEKKESHIARTWYDCDPLDRGKWAEQHQWLYEQLQVFHKVFAERVREIGRDDEVASEPPA
jgi:hypothetical protein